ncbi:polyprenyl synthetase family protein [Saccharothrix variisporea]|uniref:Geranylgeranyl diphosphate synthase type I n=1 Tax=Saccharothrix variisporea TaxID=543527 RepID=A0A495X1Q0_9PSEU|nr:polyprenyl synthetase family protein [Saccharothrix variisporea]RKT67195.1 geranylgeranyl diphosphate synthase type I [Saccharothrix variisporea]
MTTGHLVDTVPPGAPVEPCEVDFDRVRRDVDAHLADFLDHKRRTAPDTCLSRLVDLVSDFIAGGKRLRPLFCCCGWVAAGGRPDDPAVLWTAAALELSHSFALIHDDIMDASDLRRGRRTVHRSVADDCGCPPGAAERFGASTAILVGDLCFAWCDELLTRPRLPEERLRTVRRLVGTMRTELIAGQYLDIAPPAEDQPMSRAWRVVRLKTARYTVELPLQIGAALAGGDRRLLAACSAYGAPLGEAFQLRDDLLGVFGDPGVTGKPDSDDLRDGKRTVLMALAWQESTPEQREVIKALHGDPALSSVDAERLREVIVATGARGRVEQMIQTRAQRALAALRTAPVTAPARRALTDLVALATRRAR